MSPNLRRAILRRSKMRNKFLKEKVKFQGKLMQSKEITV